MKSLLKIPYAILIMSGLCLLYAEDDMEMDSEEAPEVESSYTPTAAEDMEIPPFGKMGTVTIMTKPEKARIFIGGDDLGLSPIKNHSFKSGRFDLTIMLKGEEVVKERVNIWPDKNTLIDKKLLMPYGIINVTTKPAKAVIYLDGEEIGKTEGGPLWISNVTSGTHVITAKAGSRSKQINVKIAGEDTAMVDIILK